MIHLLAMRSGNCKILLAIGFCIGAAFSRHNALAVESEAPPTSATVRVKIPPSRAELDLQRLKTFQEVVSLRERASQELMASLSLENRSHLSNREIFENFMHNAYVSWGKLSQGLQLSTSIYPIDNAGASQCITYFDWYSKNAQLIMKNMALDMDESRKLFHSQFQSLFSALFPNSIGLKIASGAIKDALEQSYVEIYDSFMQHQAPRLRSEIAEMILAGDPNDQARIETGLYLTSEKLWDVQNVVREGGPDAGRWLTGLGELVLEAKAYTPQNESTERLLVACLAIYKNVLEDFAMVKDDPQTPKVWIKDLILNPLLHIATLKSYFPEAANEAQQMLHDLAFQTKSKYLRARIQYSFSESTVSTSVVAPTTCKSLILKFFKLK